IAARILRERRDSRGLVVQIAEHDRLRRAGLRAGRRDVAVLHVAVLETRPVLRAADSLHAEGALLHHAFLPHRDVWIEQHVERIRPALPLTAPLGIVVPVEVAHLVGTVVGAVARADAAVVDLAVQAIGRVVRGVHRAHRLTGRVAALLAQHRRYHGADGAPPLTAGVVALDPEPAHLPASGHELFTHGRKIVLGVARGYAGRAAGAFGQVDRHRPARMLAGVVPERRLLVLRLRPRIERLAGVRRRLLLGEWMGSALQLARFGERQHLDDAPSLLARVPLDGGEPAMVAGLGDLDADGERAPTEVRGRVAQERKRIERAVLGVAAVRLVTLSARDR